jgi:hypothetical protein
MTPSAPVAVTPFAIQLMHARWFDDRVSDQGLSCPMANVSLVASLSFLFRFMLIP